MDDLEAFANPINRRAPNFNHQSNIHLAAANVKQKI